MVQPPQRKYSWTLNLESCPNTSVGSCVNEEFRFEAPHRKNEDRCYNGMNHNVQLCMVLDGHDGEKAADFAKLNIAGQLLVEEIVGGAAEVISKIDKVFKQTETQFFLGMDDSIIRKLTLQGEINQRAKTSYEALSLYPSQVNEITRLETQIKGGTTVVLSLIHNNELYIANVGDSRAILCQNVDGVLTASQLSDDHNIYNPGEQKRLHQLGLNVQSLLQFGRLGPFQITRSIGDYSIKGGYKEVDVLSSAREEPGSCIPFINGPWTISTLKNAFLLLMSDGLYEAYGSFIKSGNPQVVHEGIAAIVVEEMSLHRQMDRVAQATVNRIKEQLKQQSMMDGRMDDTTLIVRNFNHPLGDTSTEIDQVDTPISDPTSSHLLGHSREYPSQRPSNLSGGIFVPESSIGDNPPSRPTNLWMSEQKPSRPDSQYPIVNPNTHPKDNPTQSRIHHITTGMSDMSMRPGYDDTKGAPGRRGDQQISRRLFEEPPIPEKPLPPKPELTEEQTKSGKFIAPYIMFPSGFPYHKGLNDF